MPETVACPCGSTEPPSRLVEARDELSGQSFTYLVCPACTLERLSPRPTADEIGAYYPQHYAPHTRPGAPGWGDRLRDLVYRSYWASGAALPTTFRLIQPLLRAVLWPIRYRSVLAFMPPNGRRV